MRERYEGMSDMNARVERLRELRDKMTTAEAAWLESGEVATITSDPYRKYHNARAAYLNVLEPFAITILEGQYVILPRDEAEALEALCEQACGCGEPSCQIGAYVDAVDATRKEADHD